MQPTTRFFRLPVSRPLGFATVAVLSLTSMPAIASLIPNVPDLSQPPTSTLGADTSNFCAPMSAVNITEYWDVVMAHPNAALINAGLAPETAAEYIGYFMDTNDWGTSRRLNGTGYPSGPGTYAADQGPGLWEFVSWDPAHLFPDALAPPPPLPAGKGGYHWAVCYLDSTMVPPAQGFDFCAAKIDSGLPIKLDFFFWNPVSTGVWLLDDLSGDTVYVFAWGPPVPGSLRPDHREKWNLLPGEEGIGHAVTGVGFYRDLDPDDGGPLPQDDYIVVHDNWADTPENVAIPWAHWNAAIAIDPNFGNPIARTLDLQPHCDWGAISSWPGLAPTAGMGIWSPAHGRGFYFPTDSLAPFSGYPKAWLAEGTQPATRYGPRNELIGICPVPDALVTVPDRYSRACSLYVSIPPPGFIVHRARDSTVIQISPAETHTIAIGDTVETLVFLASCDGWAEDEYGPSPDEQLLVQLNYEDGTSDVEMFGDIHPAGRLDIDDPLYPPSWNFIFGNEVLICAPGYFDTPVRDFDQAHSEAWHWYALHPDIAKALDTVELTGNQSDLEIEIYVLAVSYSEAHALPSVAVEPSTDPAGQTGFVLHASRPNPFQAATTIRYSLPVDCQVRLEVFGVRGERVASLVDEWQQAGTRSVRWNARGLSSGIYFCRLEACRRVVTRKAILLR